MISLSAMFGLVPTKIGTTRFRRSRPEKVWKLARVNRTCEFVYKLGKSSQEIRGE